MRTSKNNVSIDIWMPVFVGDILKETSHFSAEEMGAYMRLLFHYWVKGEALPDDDARLARIAVMELEPWLKVRKPLSDLFLVEKGCWYDHKLQEEREKAISNKLRRIKSASKAGRASAKKRAISTLENTMGESGHQRDVERDVERVYQHDVERDDIH